MLNSSVDRIGDLNPQLFRELKGRLKTRNCVITIAISLLGQIILLMYCAPVILMGNIALINLREWQTIFRSLSWILPLILLISGAYLLINDLAGEERQGTLNFIRYSPQSSQTILLGKMLGVPILFYLGILLAIPLHFVSALATGWPFFWILGLYTFWIAGCFLFYSAALLYTLSLQRNPKFEPKALAGGGSLFTFLLGSGYLGLLNFFFDWFQKKQQVDLRWFFFPIGSQSGIAYGWIIITIGVATYWLWQAVNRIFYNPNTPLVSKQKSYWLVASFEGWLLGFCLNPLAFKPNSVESVIGFGTLFFFNPFFFLMLSAALNPGRQALLDWSRYRRERNTRKGFWNRAWVQDLIWEDKSPAIGAIAINFLLTTLIWSPWIILYILASLAQQSYPGFPIVLGLFVTAITVLIYAAIADLTQLLKAQEKMLLICVILGLIFLPLASFFLWGNTLFVQIMAVFLPFPVIIFGFNSVTTTILGLLAQLGALSLLSMQLTRRLQKAGESTSKAMLTGHQS
jgi:hypothetical protein